jgi:hypothetical protein
MKSLFAGAAFVLVATALNAGAVRAQATVPGSPLEATAPADLPEGLHALGEEPLAEPVGPPEEEFALPLLHFTGGELHAPDRHLGWGDPLIGSSWMNRPWSVSWFFGGFLGDEPQAGQVAFDEGMFGGYRFGYDFDHYWGAEARYGFGHPDLENLANGLPLGGGQTEYLDASVLYYPWGDAAWRPYAFLGIGAAWLQFQDENQRYIQANAFQIPWGFGVKRRLDKHWVLRFEFGNYLSFDAGGVDAMNNITITGGVEAHFGGRRPSYFPWDPGIHMLW